MATRLYLENVAAPYSPATKRGSWDTTTGFVDKKIGLDKINGGVATTVDVSESVTTNPYNGLIARFVSEKLTKDTNFLSSDTVQWIIGIKETTASSLFFWHIHIFITVGDSDTVRGTLLTDNIGATEFPSTATGRGEGTKTLTAVNALKGDRIVVEVGYRTTNTTATVRHVVLNYGSTGSTDLTSGSTSVTTLPGWIEFSTNLFTVDDWSDNFDDNSTDSIWTDTINNGTVTEQNGRVEITHTGVANSYNTRVTANNFLNLTGKAISVKLTDAGNQTIVSHEAIFPIYIDNTSGQNQLWFTASNGNLSAYKRVSNVQAQVGTSITYDPVAHLYLRFRESAGTIFWDTSPNSQTWTNRWSLTNPWVDAAFNVGVQSGCWQTETNGSYAYFDDFNITHLNPQLVINIRQAVNRAATY